MLFRHESRQSYSFESAFQSIKSVQRPFFSRFLMLLAGIAGLALPYMLSNWWNSSRDFHFSPFFNFELLIPRVNWMIIPYISAYVMGLASLPVLPYLAQKALAKAMLTSGIVGGFFFILFPTELGYERTVEGLGMWQPLYQILWALDHPFNLTPSMHVVMAYLLIVPVVKACESSWKKWALGCWLFLVCISIVLVHQHHIIDIFSGYFLGWLCDVLVYRKTVQNYAHDLIWQEEIKSDVINKKAA